MLFSSLLRGLRSRWAQSITSRPCRARASLPHSRHLAVESLENRLVPSTAAASSAFGGLPLAFEADQGQAAAQVNFLSHDGSARRCRCPPATSKLLQARPALLWRFSLLTPILILK